MKNIYRKQYKREIQYIKNPVHFFIQTGKNVVNPFILVFYKQVLGLVETQLKSLSREYEQM